MEQLPLISRHKQCSNTVDSIVSFDHRRKLRSCNRRTGKGEGGVKGQGEVIAISCSCVERRGGERREEEKWRWNDE